ncbi:MAG: virulence factor [Hyphomicrobiaceae bacterium]
MAERIIVYWRDIPAQVIVRHGRRAEKRELSKRFIEAIDRCAMRTGAKDSDAYLADWRKAAAEPCAGDLATEADASAATLEQIYDEARLSDLVAAGGRERG